MSTETLEVPLLNLSSGSVDVSHPSVNEQYRIRRAKERGFRNRVVKEEADGSLSTYSLFVSLPDIERQIGKDVLDYFRFLGDLIFIFGAWSVLLGFNMWANVKGSHWGWQFNKISLSMSVIALPEDNRPIVFVYCLLDAVACILFLHYVNHLRRPKRVCNRVSHYTVMLSKVPRTMVRLDAVHEAMSVFGPIHSILLPLDFDMFDDGLDEQERLMNKLDSSILTMEASGHSKGLEQLIRTRRLQLLSVEGKLKTQSKFFGRNTGQVFITYEDVTTAENVLRLYEPSWYDRLRCLLWPCSLRDKQLLVNGVPIVVGRPPVPEDVIWRHATRSNREQIWRTLPAILFAVGCILANSVFLLVTTVTAELFDHHYQIHPVGDFVYSVIKVLTTMGLMSVTRALLRMFGRFFTRSLQAWVSLVLSYTFGFVNTIIVLWIVGAKAAEPTKINLGSWHPTNLHLPRVLFPILVVFMALPGAWGLLMPVATFEKWRQQRLARSQLEMDQAYSSLEFRTDSRIATVMLIASFGVVFFSVLPVAAVITTVSLMVLYAVDKFVLLRWCQRTPTNAVTRDLVHCAQPMFNLAIACHILVFTAYRPEGRGPIIVLILLALYSAGVWTGLALPVTKCLRWLMSFRAPNRPESTPRYSALDPQGTNTYSSCLPAERQATFSDRFQNAPGAWSL